MLLAVDRALLGEVAEHLDAEPAVEVADNPLLPRAADDLGGQPAGGPRLGHDVVRDLVGALDQPLARHHLVDHPPLQRLPRADRLPGEQGVGCTLDPEQFGEGAVNAVGGHRADVVVQVEDGGVVSGEGDVAHQHDLGVETGPVEQADGGDLQIVDQGVDVDSPVLVGVLVGPVLHVGFLEGETLGVGGHHELIARSGQDQHLVAGVGADRLQHLAERAVVLHAELDRAAQSVRRDQQDAVVAAFHPVEVPERFPVLLEAGSGHEILQQHGHSSRSSRALRACWS